MSGILQNVLTPLIRIFRLSKFDQNVFGEIRDDSSEKLITSITIIVVSSLLAGLGSFLYWEISGNPVVENQFINTFISRIYFNITFVIWNTYTFKNIGY